MFLTRDRKQNVWINADGNILFYTIHINWRDVQTKNVANNVDMSCLRAPCQNWPVQKLAQGTTQKLLQHHDATDI